MGFGTVSRLFHWVTVLLVLVMIPVGVVMTQDVPRPLQDSLFILHKGLGPVVLVVVLLRLLWRAFHPAPPLPASVPPLQARVAKLVHAGLYFFLLVQAISGYVRVTAGGFPIETLESVGIPPLLPKSEGIGDIASTIHRISAFCLMAADRHARRRGGVSRPVQAGRGLFDDVAADRAEDRAGVTGGLKWIPKKTATVRWSRFSGSSGVVVRKNRTRSGRRWPTRGRVGSRIVPW